MNPRNGILFILFILFLAVSCRRSAAPPEIPLLVKTVEVKKTAEPSSVSYPGKIRAASDVNLSFRVAGPIRRIYVGQGQYVKKGQVLAELDPRDYRLQYEATQAEYQQIKDESDRVIELYRRGSVSVNDYDKAVAAKKRITSLYDAHRNALNDTRLKAPFDGYIQKKYFDGYEIVGQGTPVLSIIDKDYLEVTVDIPSADFVRRGDFVNYSAVADIFPDKVLPLELIEFNQGANFNQLFRGRFRMKRDEATMLAPGMSVSMVIGFRPVADSTVTVPVSALFQEKNNSYVWLYEEPEGAVRKIPVEVRRVMKDGTALVMSELKAGQHIVSAGVNSLREGQKVRCLPEMSPSNVGGLL